VPSFESPAADRWRREVQGWDIPPAILAAAPDDPWRYRASRFAASDVDPADTPSMLAALGLLADGGSLLDVGCGGGRSSLPIAGATTAVTGVDAQPAMLRLFADAAAARGVAATVVAGRWPDVAPCVDVADVVVCHHVAYNVVDIAPFLAALDDHGRRGVVLEVTAVHPQQPMSWLWARVWGVRRPSGPTASLLVDVVAAAGRTPTAVGWHRPSRHDPGGRADLVAEVRRRLCLTADRDAELDAMLPAAPRLAVEQVVTISWPSS
jgi:SAM-dependent methyltransferase